MVPPFPHFPGAIPARCKFPCCPCLLKRDSALPAGSVMSHAAPRWPLAASCFDFSVHHHFRTAEATEGFGCWMWGEISATEAMGVL